MGLVFTYVEDEKDLGDEHVKVTVTADAAEEKDRDLEALQVRHEELVLSMYREEFLNYRFSELQALQDADYPNFVEESITHHIEQCAYSIEELDKALKTDPVDYDCHSPVWGYNFQVWNSNHSIGATEVAYWCGKFSGCFGRQDKQGYLDSLEKVKEAFNILRAKFVTMLELEREISAAGGTLYYMNGN